MGRVLVPQQPRQPKVGRLAERLQAEGLKVWFDREAIADGKDIVAAIENGLERSRVLILCMTKSAFNSRWVEIERNAATFRDPANTDRRFLPLLFEDCTVRAMVHRVKFIDWRSESDDAWQQLLVALKPGAAPLPEVSDDPSTLNQKVSYRRLLTGITLAISCFLLILWLFSPPPF
jgi:hypothetical protein